VIWKAFRFRRVEFFSFFFAIFFCGFFFISLFFFRLLLPLLLVGRLLVALLLLQRVFLSFLLLLLNVAHCCCCCLSFLAQCLSIPDAWKTNYEGVNAVRVFGGAVPPNSDKLVIKGFCYQAWTLRCVWAT